MHAGLVVIAASDGVQVVQLSALAPQVELWLVLVWIKPAVSNTRALSANYPLG